LGFVPRVSAGAWYKPLLELRSPAQPAARFFAQKGAYTKWRLWGKGPRRYFRAIVSRFPTASFMKTRLHIFLAALVLSFPFSLSAQPIVWEKLDGPDGGGGAVYPEKNGGVFTLLSNGSLYHSADKGGSWQAVPAPPNDIRYVLAPVGHDGNLYGEEDNELYRSTDRGQTWGIINFGIGQIMAATGLPDNVVLIADGSGKIYRSSVGGTSWKTLNVAPEGITHFSYNPAADHVYAWRAVSGSTGKIYRSTDKGLSWALFFDGGGATLHSMAFAPNGTVLVGVEKAVWRTTDNGANWSIRLFPQPSNLNGVQVAVASSGRIYASSWGASFFSDNNGNTWNTYADADGNALSSFNVMPDGTLFARRAHSPTLRRSNDDGKTWGFAAVGIHYPEVTDVAFMDEKRLLAATLDGLFYSTDRGESWELVYDHISYASSYLEPWLDVSPSGAWYLHDGRNLIQFTDNGQKAQVVHYPWGAFSPSSEFSVHPKTGTLFNYDGWKIFRGTHAGGGTIWQESNLRAFKLVFMPDGSILAGTASGLKKSTDDGQTWQTVSAFLPSRLTASPSGILYDLEMQGTASFIWTSLDGGITWDSTKTNLSSGSYDEFIANKAEQLFVMAGVGSAKAYRSINGGQTFQAISTSFPTGYNRKLCLAPDQHLYLFTNRSGVLRSAAPSSTAIWGKNMPSLSLGISPNPMTQQAVVSISGELPDGGGLLLECYGTAGRLLRSQRFEGRSVTVERGDLPSGAYLMVVKTALGAVLGSGLAVMR
jgi:photosystem II stability/assembly factor-like uncharacterized protein